MKWWREMVESERIQLIHWLINRELLDIPIVATEQVSTVKLESLMQEIDWDYAFYDPLYANTEVEGDDLLIAQQIEQIVFDLQDLEKTGGDALAASQLLQIKHWSEKDMEIQMSQIQSETLDYVIGELSAAFLKKLSNKLKDNSMKEDVFNYLSNEIKFGGFDESLIGPLKEALLKGEDKFQLEQTTTIGKDEVRAILNFSKGKDEKYYFNSFDLTIAPSGNWNEAYHQHVPRQKDAKFTLKQGYNLANGRAVAIVHINEQKQMQESWSLQDKKFTYKDGSPLIKTLPASYKYVIEDALSKYNILNLRDEDEKIAFLKNIRKGNVTEATIERSDGFTTRIHVTANPLTRAANFYDISSGQKLNRNEFLVPGHQKNETHEKKISPGQNEMDAPDLPEQNKRKRLNR